MEVLFVCVFKWWVLATEQIRRIEIGVCNTWEGCVKTELSSPSICIIRWIEDSRYVTRKDETLLGVR